MPASPDAPEAVSRLASPEVLDDLLLYRLSRLQATAGGMVVRHCEGRFGITRREWRIVALLASRGPMGSSELAEHAHLDRPRTSKAVTTLTEKKLVNRSSRAGDARQIRLALTAAGSALHAQLFPLVRQINQDVLQVLQPAEIALLADILTRLQQSADTLAAEGGLPLADRRHGSSARRYKPAAD
ncbi:MAG: MarR family transcriptional regulator [Polaromonas sp.]|uniref:MarR family winged helix-turn-helix transcriptional regulator n=1 Tax=Polaromonas sp. TaxID=1869339 RepID=UPI0027322F58|nr:MarR family transcriptional regulator [Polaromonas sp.]MDP2819032.1 MarR family transcriptional regulator [Polaromonas sp.]